MKKSYSIKISSDKTVSATVADTFFTRLTGLLFANKQDIGKAMLFPNCRFVHTFFMRQPLEIHFLGKNMMAVKPAVVVKPWRIAFCLKASAILEIVIS